MRRTPPRPRLFSHPSITRKILLQYSEGGTDVVRDITGAALDTTTVDQLNDRALNACVVVDFAPNDPANAPLAYKYFIEKFPIDHSERERILEILFEPWSSFSMPPGLNSKPPLKVISHGANAVFVQVIVKLVTLQEGKRGFYDIRSTASLNLITGVISFQS